MGAIGRKRRQFEINKKKKRHEKLKKLGDEFVSAKNAAERDRIRDKIQRIAPHLSLDKYLDLTEKPK